MARPVPGQHGNTARPDSSLRAVIGTRLQLEARQARGAGTPGPAPAVGADGPPRTGAPGPTASPGQEEAPGCALKWESAATARKQVSRNRTLTWCQCQIPLTKRRCGGHKYSEESNGGVLGPGEACPGEARAEQRQHQASSEGPRVAAVAPSTQGPSK